jgi:hypothetical protein
VAASFFTSLYSWSKPALYYFDIIGQNATRINLKILREGKYALVCGIIALTVDKATGQLIPFPPPLKAEKDRQGSCIILDVSTPKAS